MKVHVIITALHFRPEPFGSASERCWRRLAPTITAEFCDIVQVSVDVLIKALRILDAFIYSHQLLGDQTPD